MTTTGYLCMQAENLDSYYLSLDVMQVKICQVIQTRWKLIMRLMMIGMVSGVTNNDHHYRLW